MTTLLAPRPCVRFKSGVTLGDPPTEAQTCLLSACQRAARLFGRDVMVTAGRNNHDAESAHGRGRALDIRTRDWSEADTVALYDFLVETLGGDFYVQVEAKVTPVSAALQAVTVVSPQASASHIHAQVRRGMPVWPPQDYVAPDTTVVA